MEITRQSDHYGFADPRLAALAEERTAAVRPDEVADLLHGPRIQAGMLRSAEDDARSFDRGPVREGRAVTADHGDMRVMDGIAAENGWSVDTESDPGGAQRSLYRYNGEYVVGVKWKKFSPDVVESASLSTQDPLGWPRDAIASTTNQNVVRDWLQLFFLEEPRDLWATRRTAGRAVITAASDPDLDLFEELSSQGMSMDDMGKEIARRNYTDREEQKAFRKGWRSGFTGKDGTHYDKLTEGWPPNLYHAFFSAYEIVRTYW